MFVDDPEMRDGRTGQQFCLCGLPADNEKHTLQRRKDDERDAEARKMGERS